MVVSVPVSLELSSDLWQVCLGKWSSMLLSLCISFILATMTTLLMGLLKVTGIDKKIGWQSSDRSPYFYLTILYLAEFRLCYIHLLMNIHMNHKHLHVICLFKMISLYTFPTNVFPSNFLIILFPYPNCVAKTLALSEASLYNYKYRNFSFKA